MKFTRKNIVGLLASLSICPSASAFVAINNLTVGGFSFASTVSGPVGAGILAPPPNRESAFSFVTGSADTYLMLFEASVNVSNNSVGLHATISTGASVPGGTNLIDIGTVTPASTSPTTQLLAFTPASSILLTASTRYWIHLTVQSGSGSYSFNNTQSQVVEPGWTLENTHYYQPSSWNEINNGPQARVRLTVDPVPEPGTALLGCVSMIALFRRRR